MKEKKYTQEQFDEMRMLSNRLFQLAEYHYKKDMPIEEVNKNRNIHIHDTLNKILI